MRRASGWFVLAGPGATVYAVIVLVPILMAFAYSLTNLNSRFPDTDFIGLDNYVRLFQDSQFWEAARHTVVITLMLVVLPNVAGLAIALLLDRATRPYLAMRSVFFIPVTLSAVVVSFVWSTILTDNGVLNTVLRGIGLEVLTRSWLGDSSLAIYSIGVVMSWQMLGFCAVVFLAGLKAIPSELVEAAVIDGAGPWQRFRYVTWRGLAPALTINVIMMLINGLRTFDHVVVLTGGGPAGSTETIATSIVQLAFQNTRIAYASAMAIVLLLFIAAVCATVLRGLQSREIVQ